MSENKDDKAAKGPSIEALQAELEAAKQVIAEQNAIIEAQAEQSKAKHPIVKVGKDTYEIISGVRTGGKDYSIKDLQDKENAKVVEELVKKGSGILRKLNLKK